MMIWLVLQVAVLCVSADKEQSALFSVEGTDEAWMKGDADGLMKMYSKDAVLWDKDGETSGVDAIEKKFVEDYNLVPPGKQGADILVARFAPVAYQWEDDTEFLTAAEMFDNFNDSCFNVGVLGEWIEKDGGRGVTIMEINSKDKIQKQLIIQVDNASNPAQKKQIKKLLKKTKKTKKKKNDDNDAITPASLPDILKTAKDVFEASDVETWSALFSKDADVTIFANGVSMVMPPQSNFWEAHWIEHERITWNFFAPTEKGFVIAWVVAEGDEKSSNEAQKLELNGEAVEAKAGEFTTPQEFSDAGFGISVVELDEEGLIKTMRCYFETHPSDQKHDPAWPECLHA